MSNITEHQQKIIDIAQELLIPYNKEDVSRTRVYFEKQNKAGDCIGEYDSEYDCCDNEECEETTLAKLKKEHPKDNIQSRYQDSYSCECNIDRCCVCGCALSEFLNDVMDELEHHKKYSKTKKQITSSALEITAVLYGFYVTERELERYPKETKKKITSIVNYAKKVIRLLFPLTDQEIKDLERIGGLYTIKGDFVTNDIRAAKYLKSGDNCTFWQPCFMYEDFHAETLYKAKKERKRRLNEKEQELKSKLQYEANLKKTYSYRDSINAGNCRDGTRVFIQRGRLNIRKRYTGEFLMKIAEKQGLKSYVERMIQKG